MGIRRLLKLKKPAIIKVLSFLLKLVIGLGIAEPASSEEASQVGGVVDLVDGAQVNKNRIPSAAAFGGRTIAALVDRGIDIICPDKVAGHVLVDTGQRLTGLVGGVLGLAENAAAHVGGAIPDKLCEVGNALADAQAKDSGQVSNT